MAIWYMYFVVIWYIFPRFGILYQEKSCNSASQFPKNTFDHWESLTKQGTEDKGSRYDSFFLDISKRRLQFYSVSLPFAENPHSQN
jgi:hypothetical protein